MGGGTTLKAPNAGQSFAEWLRDARRQAGLTQEQLAAVVHVRPLAVSRWESGKQVPPPHRRRDVERALGVGEGLTLLKLKVGDETSEYRATGLPTVPLYIMGHIAGTTDGEPEKIDDLEITSRQRRLADAAFVVHGTSMEPAFQNGDIVGVKLLSEARRGQLVVARVDDELTFKRYDGVQDGLIVLTPLNPEHAPIIRRNVTILGIYRWVIREALDGEA